MEYICTLILQKNNGGVLFFRIWLEMYEACFPLYMNIIQKKAAHKKGIPHPFRVNDQFEVDLDRVISITACGDAVRLIYVDSESETVALPEEDRNRLFDHWLGIA